MTIPEEKLLAYVDGRLSAEEADALAREIAGDTEAEALVADLRKSALPYREAVETLVHVPDLSGIEASMAATARSTGTTSAGGGLYRFAGMAAAVVIVFAAGLLAGPHLLGPSAPEKTKWAVWVDRIANYQALYSRDTLYMPTPPAQRRQWQMTRVSKALGNTVAAPDLSDASYKYARLYAIDGEALAQIAYLPDKGEPFSLCLMKTAKADHGPRYTQAHGMNVATWRHGGVAYVIVGDMERPKMDDYISEIRRQQGV